MLYSSYTNTPTLCAGLIGACLLFAANGGSQEGDARDKPGTVQSENWRQIDVPPAPPLSPSDAADTFTLPDGYWLELVAAEPLVHDPVAITWDEDSRLWVAEMRAYMPNADGQGEDQPVSRVVVLEDADGDGVMDQSTVFLDGLVMPRAIALVAGGVLIADPPNLMFCADTNGDLRADHIQTVATYAAEGNVEHAENGLLLALDNWYYNAKSDRRFQFRDGQLIEERTYFRGQWGITQDDYGRLFYNHNSDLLLGDYIPSKYTRLVGRSSRSAGLEQRIVADHSLQTARVNPGVNRGYDGSTLSEDFRLPRPTAASAPVLYRGNLYPDALRGAAFIPEPSGNVVAAHSLSDSGLRISTNKLSATHPRWGEVEFIASTDERFRPVAAANGPDGSLYIVDMYRGILQHKTYLTTYLRTQIEERGLDRPLGLGRIYRLRHRDYEPALPWPKLSSADGQELIQFLHHPNGWHRDTAQRLLIQGPPLAPDELEALRKSAQTGSELGRIHSIWTLEGINAFDHATFLAVMQNASEWIQVHAWRAAESFLADKEPTPAIAAALEQARSSSSQRVRLQAWHSMGQLPSNASQTMNWLEATSEADLLDPLFQEAIAALFSPKPSVALAAYADAPETMGAKALLRHFGTALLQSRDAAAIADALSPLIAKDERDWAELSLLSGIAREAQRRGFRPIELAAQPDWISGNVTSEFWVEDLRRAFAWPGKDGTSVAKEVDYSAEDLTRIETGKPLYANYCAICHGQDGEGMANLGPPLAGSEWVTGSKSVLAAVVYNGLQGPITVNGMPWDGLMPAHANHPALQGENLAAVLSFIRHSWGNRQSAYKPAELESILEPYKDRAEPWSAKELQDVFSE